MIDTIKKLIDELGKLDPGTEQYEELADEIKLLQNDLVTIAILGEN